MPGLRLSSLLLLGAASLVGCAAETTAPAEHLGRTASPIVNGTSSPSDQDFVVQLALDTVGTTSAQCSASLVAKNLIVTARHCVGDVSESGSTMLNTYDATRLSVFVGKDGPEQIEGRSAPAARGKRVFTPPGKSMLPDLAFILLDRSVTAPVAKIRLYDTPKKDETVDVVGFGMNEANENVRTRMQKTNVRVRALAPEVTAFHNLNAGEFAFGEAACYGDSGGPAISTTTNAIVGVASRVNSGVAGTDDEPNKMCLGAEDVYTSLLPFKSLVEEAFAAAGAKPLLEAEAPPAKEKAKTTQAAKLGDTEDRADFWDSPQDSDAGGCATAPAAPSSGLAATALLVGLVLASRRRRYAI